jgi:outer membrane protein assembly factor BamA
MRWRQAQIAILAMAWVLTSQQWIHAQNTLVNLEPEIQSEVPCAPSSASKHRQPPGPEISIVEVTFSGSLLMPLSDQEQIADSVVTKTHGTSLDDVTDDGLERVRAGWQNRGYFKVRVTGETRTLTSSPVSQRIALHVHVDEGARYTLNGISFKNNRAVSNAKSLRGLFPITDGDIFNREKIGLGLENLRKTYGQFGYLNFTSVPDTQVDDENKAISLDIDFDEGKQFIVGSIHVLGLDEPARQELLNRLPIKPGQIYNSRLWEAALLENASVLPECDCLNHEQLREDAKSGVVTLTLDFRPCSAN